MGGGEGEQEEDEKGEEEECWGLRLWWMTKSGNRTEIRAVEMEEREGRKPKRKEKMPGDRSTHAYLG